MLKGGELALMVGADVGGEVAGALEEAGEVAETLLLGVEWFVGRHC